ncbi:MAG: carboxymuconolactone decarboxylase family protein [candidate division Zixibacteria bacterium]|nr:carboxymuconolactone decarboxylase family protein [candidate division Zixibacteria bacterium]
MVNIIDEAIIAALKRDFTKRWKVEYFYLPMLSASIAGRADEVSRMLMQAALDDGVSAKMIDEAILQVHLFLGFPAMIEAARAFAEIHPRRYKKSQLPEAYNSKTTGSWNRNGLQKIRKIYGSAFDRLIPYINSFSPQILTWMINDGYGQVLSRPGVSFRLRELSVTATLTVTGYVNQLGAHIRGALNTGAEKKLLFETMTNCGLFCSRKNCLTAQKILRKVTAEQNA